MKRSFLLVLSICCYIVATAQTTSFPADWKGNWKGELQWYKAGKADPEKVNMELRIYLAETPGQYDWHIIYGAIQQDSRPYLLKPVDSSGVHWVIDERNGIILDQYWVGNRFTGAFSVQQSTLVNSYYLEDNKLIVEFTGFGKKPVNTTGAGTDESPTVDSYQVRSYQKAILYRIN